MPKHAPPSHGYCTFETPLGTMAATWRDERLTSLHLPEACLEDLLATIARRHGDLPEVRPPRPIRAALRTLGDHLKGRRVDLATLPLDLDWASPFHRKVYEASRTLDYGETVTYGQLAELAGSPAPRAVGQAMAKNRFPIVVPCHRVVAAGGKPGGFNAHGALDTKERLLAIEGASLEPKPPPRPLPYDWEAAVAHLRRKDPVLGRWIDKVGDQALELTPLVSPFQHLVRAIVYQQLSGRAAGTILRRVLALFPGRRFPTPQDLLDTPAEDLRGAGLSRAKVAAVHDLAARTLDGTVPSMRAADELPDDELVERLSSVRGVGRWTVEMLLLFGLGRPDVLPLLDLGIQKGFARMTRRKELPSKQELAERGERWRPYRSVASWYLWRFTEL